MRQYLVHIFKAWLLIPFLNVIGKTKKTQLMQDKLVDLPEGSLGKEMDNWLKKYKINLIAGYENHDVKHVLTGYQSEGLDEIRLQVFMLGNGNYSLTCLLLCAMALIFPEEYATFKTDFAKGSLCKSLKNIDLEVHGKENLEDLKEQLGINKVNEISSQLNLNVA